MKHGKGYLLTLIGLAAVYYGAAKLGLSLAFETPSVTAVWAPTGISLAALVLFGFRLWPGIAAGALLANLGTGVPFLAVLGIAAGNTLEALAGAYLLVRVVDFRPSLERVSDVVWLVVLGGLLSTMVSATIGSTSLLAAGEIDGGAFGETWRTWWLGDMGGDLVLAPALLVAVSQWPHRHAARHWVEGLALAVLVAGTALFAFTREAPVTFLLVPLPIVAAFRFGQLGAVVAAVLTAAVAIPMTEDMQGPFADYAPDDRLVFATLLVGMISLTALIIAAVIAERKHAEDAVRQIADTLKASLLPADLPVIPGVQTAIEFRPAGDREIVGGDFYEVVESDDGSIGIAIGDALGKGAAAAADTALARYTLRAAALHEGLPSRILGLLNEAMLRSARDHPCTAAYVRIDRDGLRGRVTVSTGGHPKPLIVRASGVVEPVGVPAPPLGVRPDIELTDHEAWMDPGDSLVLYTDGLTDAFAPRRAVSADDIAAALAPRGGASASEMVETASALAVAEGGRPPRDDILIFALRLDDAGG